MTELYWICLVGGLVAAVLAALGADALEDALEVALPEALDPLALLGGVTAFGGAGLLLERYAALGPAAEAGAATAVGLALALALTFGYIRPMRRAENSTGFSRREYRGRLGEVNTAVPARGYGEVLVRLGHATTFQPAASFDGRPIPTGTSVVVVEVEADGSLRVAPFEDAPAGPPDALAAPAAGPTRVRG